MPERDWRLLVSDILDCINKVEKYISGMNYDEFINDDKTIDAVIRNFSIIGEAANRIPIENKKLNSDIDWVKIVGLRNRIIHDYFGVDLEIIWYIIQNELKILESELRKII